MFAYNVFKISVMNDIKSACVGNSIPVRGIEAEISFCPFIFINPLFIQVKSVFLKRYLVKSAAEITKRNTT